MDISKASNFERFVFDLLDRDAERTRRLFAEDVVQGGFSLAGAEFDRVTDFGFAAGRSSHTDRLATIARVYADAGRLIDTHTADGVHVARDHLDDGVPMVVLETAQPVKFADVVREATGITPPLPPAVADLESRPQRVQKLPADLEAVKQFIERNAIRDRG